jgi:glycosyltransferase involved in cell wall biosynthesis
VRERAFNGASVLQVAIDSILAQTYRDYELIILDDASTDASPRIAASYRDERIQWGRTVGLGYARNRSRAILLSKSDLIKFAARARPLDPPVL